MERQSSKTKASCDETLFGASYRVVRKWLEEDDKRADAQWPSSSLFVQSLGICADNSEGRPQEWVRRLQGRGTALAPSAEKAGKPLDGSAFHSRLFPFFRVALKPKTRQQETETKANLNHAANQTFNGR
jgi:hypothetical protein